MDRFACDVCHSDHDVLDPLVGVSCCNGVFHTSCLKVGVCPRCQNMYTILQENPILIWIKRIPANLIGNIYASIYNNNPELLRGLDQMLRSQYSKTVYHEKFKGYFPYDLFKPIASDIAVAFQVFTYGLLKSYDWNNTSACGYAVLNLATREAEVEALDREHVYLIINSRDYRKVRRQLEHLLNTIKRNAEEVGFPMVLCYIQEGILVVTIRGIVRKFCICVEFTDDPYWVIYAPRKYFNTYGCIYTPKSQSPGQNAGQGVEITVKAITETQPQTQGLPSLELVMGYKETISSYSKRLGGGLVDLTVILNDIYSDLRVQILTRPGIDLIKQNMVKLIREDLQDIIDVETADGTGNSRDISIRLISNNGREITIPTTIINQKTIKKEVARFLYLQPVQLQSQMA